jgi:hypothetical protein
MSELLQSHRTAGYEIARTTDDTGREFIILQTAPHKEEAALAHTLRPMAPDEVKFKIGVLLTEVIEQARFLGLDREQIAALFQAELERE